jgi:hypothetical protein
VLVLTLILTVVFMNGEKLGIKVISDEDAESYSGSTYFTENDLDGNWAENKYTTYISLDGSGGKIDGNGAYFLDGDLVISNAGWYVISGALDDGGIVVDAYDSSKVWIRLDGVTLSCTDDACLRVDQADKVFLTLAEGTENSFTSGDSYSEEALADNTGGTIFSHDDLTINGSGSLTITAGYKHGIDVNDSLVITGGSITITAPEDGIHVNDSFRYKDASLTIDAGDDAIHSDAELYVESGVILIKSCYEGLEAVTIDVAGGDITVYSTDDGFNANGNSGGMNFGGGGFGGMGFGGRDFSAGSSDGTGFGGQGSGADSSDGAGSSGEGSDGTGSSSEASGSEGTDGQGFGGRGFGGRGFGGQRFGGMNSASAESTGDATSDAQGTMSATGTDGGQDMAAADGAGNDRASMPADASQQSVSSESDAVETYIRISGGTITIINETGRDADGLDSNGSIYIEGGDIRVSLLGDGSNCAIDYGSESGGECVVTGGTIMAFGGSSMAEEFSSSSTQCAVLYNLDSTMPADTTFSVSDADGKEILSYTPACSYSSVSFSSPELAVGETYTVAYGENSAELAIDSTAMSVGTASGMGGMGGMMHGNMRGDQQGNMTQGSMTQDSMSQDNADSSLQNSAGSVPQGNVDSSDQDIANSNGTAQENTDGAAQNSAGTNSTAQDSADGNGATQGNPGSMPQRNEDSSSNTTQSSANSKGSMQGNAGNMPQDSADATLQGDGTGTAQGDASDTTTESLPGQPGEAGSDRPAPPDGQMGEMADFSQMNDLPQGRNAENSASASDSSGSGNSSSFVSLEELDMNVWILLGASFLTLAAAIIFAMKYRR